jgi:NAD(P)H dehydrogenase (quinone)
MSRVLVVHAHPGQQSFNRALRDALLDGLRAGQHEIEVSDLYADQFDPAMTAAELYDASPPAAVVREQARVSWCELLVLVYPVWWWGPPAILKGWLERVLCLGYAFRYEIARNGYAGLLAPRRAAIISTASADPRTYPEPWQAEVQTKLVPAILGTAGIETARQLALTEIHQYAPPEVFADALAAVGTFARTIDLSRPDNQE